MGKTHNKLGGWEFWKQNTNTDIWIIIRWKNGSNILLAKTEYKNQYFLNEQIINAISMEKFDNINFDWQLFCVIFGIMKLWKYLPAKKNNYFLFDNDMLVIFQNSPFLQFAFPNWKNQKRKFSKNRKNIFERWGKLKKYLIFIGKCIGSYTYFWLLDFFLPNMILFFFAGNPIISTLKILVLAKKDKNRWFLIFFFLDAIIFAIHRN